MIEIRLVGDEALAYIQNEKLKDAEYDKLISDFNQLRDERDNYKRKYEALAAQEAPATSKVLDDSKKVQDLKEEKKSVVFKAKKYQPDVEPEEKVYPDTTDGTWREAVDIGVPADRIKNKAWDPGEDEMLQNAFNKTDTKYYSIPTLVRYLGRSRDSIRTRVINKYKGGTSGNLIQVPKKA